LLFILEQCVATNPVALDFKMVPALRQWPLVSALLNAGYHWLNMFSHANSAYCGLWCILVDNNERNGLDE
jgi:hypothetical protein